MCSFWLAEALTRAGRVHRAKLNEARLLFERMLGHANHVGLYSEEIGAGVKHSGTSHRPSLISLSSAPPSISIHAQHGNPKPDDTEPFKPIHQLTNKEV